jgi:hypothetical protein
MQSVSGSPQILRCAEWGPVACVIRLFDVDSVAAVHGSSARLIPAVHRGFRRASFIDPVQALSPLLKNDPLWITLVLRPYSMSGMRGMSILQLLNIETSTKC